MLLWRQPPESNVVFFVGDRVEGTYNQEIERLSKLETIAAILVSKLGPSVNAWVVEPSHYKGSFACYDNLVPSLTTSGEPSGASYNPSGLPASRACLSLLTNCLSQVCLSACLSPVLFWSFLWPWFCLLWVLKNAAKLGFEDDSLKGMLNYSSVICIIQGILEHFSPTFAFFLLLQILIYLSFDPVMLLASSCKLFSQHQQCKSAME
jgi:hypothetical protein